MLVFLILLFLPVSFTFNCFTLISFCGNMLLRVQSNQFRYFPWITLPLTLTLNLRGILKYSFAIFCEYSTLMPDPNPTPNPNRAKCSLRRSSKLPEE